MQIKLEELRELFTNKTTVTEVKNNDAINMGKNIVVLQRGWVVIGDLEKIGDYFTLRNGSTIRVWGTTNGLGQIAKNGPTSSTKLDAIPETKFHELTTILIIKCEK